MGNRARLARFEANSFEVLIAFACVVTACVFFAAPNALNNSSIGQTFRPWDVIWNAELLLGGAAILLALWNAHVGLEIAGLLLVCSAVLILCVSVVAIRGMAGAASVSVDLAAALTCIARARSLWRYARLGSKYLGIDEP